MIYLVCYKISLYSEKKRKKCVFFCKFKIIKFNQFLTYYDLSSVLQNKSLLGEKLKNMFFSVNLKSQNLISF